MDELLKKSVWHLALENFVAYRLSLAIALLSTVLLGCSERSEELSPVTDAAVITELESVIGVSLPDTIKVYHRESEAHDGSYSRVWVLHGSKQLDFDVPDEWFAGPTEECFGIVQQYMPPDYDLGKPVEGSAGTVMWNTDENSFLCVRIQTSEGWFACCKQVRQRK